MLVFKSHFNNVNLKEEEGYVEEEKMKEIWPTEEKCNFLKFKVC